MALPDNACSAQQREKACGGKSPPVQAFTASELSQSGPEDLNKGSRRSELSFLEEFCPRLPLRLQAQPDALVRTEAELDPCSFQSLLDSCQAVLADCLTSLCLDPLDRHR